MIQTSSTPLSNARILLIVGGGIAAYKALDLIRRLRERGARVRVVMTPAAKQFVTPLSLASLSGNQVYDDLFSLTDEAQMGHIELSRAADLIVVAPATADLLARMAHGLANDLATTLLLATDTKVLVAPAMNLRMWLHPATQRNVAQLQADGVLFVGPDAGEMACGEYGPGRMAEPLDIVAAAKLVLQTSTKLPLPANLPTRPAGSAVEVTPPRGLLQGVRVVVTSGPTHEPLDPVRYIANRSSGRQGHAIARAAAAAGADVVLVSGPVSLPDPTHVRTIHVETARDMLVAVNASLPADIFISTAAVADWRPAEVASQKVKKDPSSPPATFQLVENPDILDMVAHRTMDRPTLVVGFAAETEHVAAFAQAKLAKKGCDLIVANDVSTESGVAGGVMGGDHNKVQLITAAGSEAWPVLSKEDVAHRLIATCAQLYADRLAAQPQPPVAP